MPVKVKDNASADDTSILDYLEIQFENFDSTAGLKSEEELWQEFKCVIRYCIRKNMFHHVLKKRAQKSLDHPRYNSHEKEISDCVKGAHRQWYEKSKN